MNIAEVSLVVIAIATVAIAAIAAIVLVRLGASLRHAESLFDQTTQSLQRLNALVESISNVVVDVGRIERRIGGVAHVLLDEVEPPLRQAAAILSGLRAGVGAWMRSRPATDGGQEEPKGGSHG